MDGVLSIARTDAEGNAFWSARDLMPLMGYARWQTFLNAVTRAMRTAENTGMTCNFTQSRKVVQRDARGGVESTDWHLDRMAAYLVAMNGDPNKPEVAAYPRQLPPFSKRANLQPCSPYLAQRANITH